MTEGTKATVSGTSSRASLTSSKPRRDGEGLAASANERRWEDRDFRVYSALLLVAAWFGVAAGLLEGITRSLLRGVSGFVYLNSPDILWIAPAFNLTFFAGIAAAVCVPLYLWAAAPSAALVAAFFAWIAFSGLLLTLGKMSQSASLILSLGIAWQIGRRLQGREQQLLSFLRRTLLPLLIATAAIGAAGARWDGWHERSLLQALPAARAGAPNLLFITLDTLRADHLSSYGYERHTTPNIDRLARQGVLFERAIANSSWTLPSHASLFTGRLPHEHQADWLDPLDGTYPTVAEVLAAQGYATAAFAANTTYVTPEWGLARGFTRFDVYGSSLADDIGRTLYGKKLALNVLPRVGYFDIPGRKQAWQVNREFFGWMDGNNKERPFFAFLNYLDVHDPYLPVGADEAKLSERVPRGDLVNFQFQPSVFRRRPTLTAQEIETEVNGYDACLAYLDAQLGQLFEELAARGLEQNTLIVLTADHGEAFGNHDLFGHGNSLYIETLHVPLIFVWPGHVPAGKRIASTVSLHRLPATVLDLFGRAASPPFPGTSLAALWSSDGSDPPGDAVVSEVSPGRFKEGPPSYPTTSGWLKSVVTDRWHLIRSQSGRTELYAWGDDREEARDLATTPAGQAVIPEIERLLP